MSNMIDTKELVEALKAALAWNAADIESYDDATPNMDMLEERRKVLQKALAKAKGE